MLYFIGHAYEALGQSEAARASYEHAAAGKPSHGSEAHYYQALALRRLKREEEARRIFAALVRRGESELRRASGIDYFAKFGERRSERSRQAAAHYLLALGYLGQENRQEARREIEKVLELDATHLGARLIASLAQLNTRN